MEIKLILTELQLFEISHFKQHFCGLGCRVCVDQHCMGYIYLLQISFSNLSLNFFRLFYVFVTSGLSSIEIKIG